MQRAMTKRVTIGNATASGPMGKCKLYVNWGANPRTPHRTKAIRTAG